MTKPRSLINCTACYKQVSQVSVWPGDQSGLRILKGTTNLAPETR